MSTPRGNLGGPVGFVYALLALLLLTGGPARAATLAPGDILAVTLGRDLLRIDPVTGATERIATVLDIPMSSGGSDVAVDRTGAVYVAGFHGLVRVDPTDGSSAPIASFPTGNLDSLAVAPDGSLVALNARGGLRSTDQVWRVDPTTGVKHLLFQSNRDSCGGPSLPPPFPPPTPCTSLLQNFAIGGLSVDAAGDIVLGVEHNVDGYTETVPGAYRLDATSGAVTFLAADPAVDHVHGVAVGPDGAIHLGAAELTGSNNNICLNSACEQIRAVEASDGSLPILSAGGLLQATPFDLAAELDGSVVVFVDGYATATNYVDRRIVRIDPRTGAQTLVAVIPDVAGITVVPELVPEPGTAFLVACGLALLRTRRRA
jgi:hypothetical protein